MESTLVVKVKYGDTLRRFTARVNGNNRLDLDMAGLRARILPLFNFAADANLVLTYVDEDGDLVTLADDDDLQEVMRQDLKFLKIDVHISNDSGANSNGSSGGNANPRSPPSPNPSVTASVFFAPGFFDGVPEQFRGPVTQLTTDYFTSSPVVSAFVDSALRAGMAVPDPHGQADAAPGPGC